MLIGLIALVAFPGGFVEKSRLLMHGLCAQTPSHTFSFGGKPLPFDARMTGIYSGTLVTLLYLAARGRLLAGLLPPMRFVVVLAFLVAAMAADGFNSLLTDLGWWHPWESSNSLRLITGYGMGIAIAIALVWLVAGTIFQVADRQPSFNSWRDVALCLFPLTLLLLLTATQSGWLHIPISLMLMFSAWIVLSTLAMVTFLLATKYDERVMHLGQLHIPGAVGMALGLVAMLALALGRTWLERSLGITTTL